MSIEDMIFNGASEEEIMKALNEIKAEKARQDAALRAKKEAQQNTAEKEALRAEARAYAINAVLAYLSAFDLLPEGEAWDDDDVERLEGMFKRLEEMIPLYIKLYKLQNDMIDKRDEFTNPDNFGFALGLF